VAIARVLIANRGEIAVRIVRACRALGIEAVVGHSEADADGMAVELADGAVCLGGARPGDSYLNVAAVVSAARAAGCDAVHPGYGFLAEQPALAEACARAGIVFIGPDAETIRSMGNKLAAREAVAGWGVPVVPGSLRVRTAAEAARIGDELGYPLMVKAAAGGGGRGIKVIDDASQLAAAIATAGAEAQAAFGDDALFIERYIADARHIEIQVLGDGAGNVVQAGERDCSVQRRYQKVVEEAPAAGLADTLIGDIRAAAVTVARNIGYRNAGTVEFIVDQAAGSFYFLEMNTRIQVEHPVTELVTGLDLVQEQLRIAGGAGLSVTQPGIAISGHAIECRITAEAPADGFRPSPGRITLWRPPEMAGVRLDSHCREGTVITPYYDSLLAKLIVHGPSRIAAIARLQAALAAFRIEGIETNLAFLRRLACALDWLRGGVNTRWLEANLRDLAAPAGAAD